MKYKINEIFNSIQGEGFYAGSPATFIRFAGCNLSCPFCDTNHNVKYEMTFVELMKTVKRMNRKIIILTGGEPSLQLDREIIKGLHALSRRIHIETNGTMPLPIGLDWITLSPKTDDFIDYGNELKVIWLNEENMERYKNSSIKHRFIQPIDGENVKEIINYIERNQEWRLSIQMHKVLGIS
jgi:organic radical activating enzyme